MGRVCRLRRTRRTVVKRSMIVVVAAVAATAALTVPGAAQGRAVRPGVPVLRWTSCGGGFECAVARVPLDYDNPAGPRISLSLIRLPATDQRHRLGSGPTNSRGPPPTHLHN